MGLKRGVLRNGDIIGDGHIVPESFVLNSADADAVPILLDGRILLDALYFLLCRYPAASKPRFARFHLAAHHHRIRVTLVHGDVA